MPKKGKSDARRAARMQAGQTPDLATSYINMGCVGILAVIAVALLAVFCGNQAGQAGQAGPEVDQQKPAGPTFSTRVIGNSLKPLYQGQASARAKTIARRLSGVVKGEGWSLKAAEGLRALGNAMLQAVEEDMGAKPCAGTKECRAAEISHHPGAFYSAGLAHLLYPGLTAMALEAGQEEGHNEQVGMVELERRGRELLCQAQNESAKLLEAKMVYDWGGDDNVTVVPADQGGASGEGDYQADGGSAVYQEKDVVLVKLGGTGGGQKFYISGHDGVIHTGTDEATEIFSQASKCFTGLHVLPQLLHAEHHIPTMASALGFSGGEYYHWVTEGLPRVLYLSHWLDDPGKSADWPEVILLVPEEEGGRRAYIAESLNVLQHLREKEEKTWPYLGVLPLPTQAQVSCDQLLVVDWKESGTGGTSSGSGSPHMEMLAPRAALSLLHSTFLPHSQQPGDDERNLIVYASRPLGSRRGVGNEDEVMEALEQVALEEGLSLYRFNGAEEGFAKGIEVFSRAKVVVGAHGAALTNTVFCSPGTVLVEARLPEAGFDMFEHIAASVGVAYRAVMLPLNQYDSQLMLDAGAMAEAVRQALHGAVAAAAAAQ